jgi:uncharacterized membrane-anchored protein
MIKFDEFTNKHLKYFIDKKKNETNTFIFPTLKEKKEIINKYIKNNNIKYKIEEYKISENKINKLVDTQWVYKEVLNSLGNLTANYKITWIFNPTKSIVTTNCIFIKSII